MNLAVAVAIPLWVHCTDDVSLDICNWCVTYWKNRWEDKITFARKKPVFDTQFSPFVRLLLSFLLHRHPTNRKTQLPKRRNRSFVILVSIPLADRKKKEISFNKTLTGHIVNQIYKISIRFRPFRMIHIKMFFTANTQRYPFLVCYSR